MQDLILKVKDFQQTFDQVVNRKPTLVDLELANLRFELMKEENEEYIQAVIDKDVVEVADALGDQLYILIGTILSHVMQEVIVDVFNEIHRSNMSKLDENGKPIINGQNGVLDITRELGKVLKSPRYSKPNFDKILKNA
jgi:predicted HAD superfamily Cof-like phosphohydrolase